MAITKLATLTASGVSSASFSGISGSYNDLKILGSAHSDWTGSWGNTLPYQRVNIQFNGDTSSVYFVSYGYATGTTSTGVTDGWTSYTYAQEISVPLAPNSYSSQDDFSAIEMYIPAYAGSRQKRCRVQGSFMTPYASAGGPDPIAIVGNGGWDSTSAITSISFALDYGDFVSGTSFTLYGISNS